MLCDAADFFGSDLQKGLTKEKIKENGEKYGKNSFPPPEKKSVFKMILEQFEDKMVIVLLFAVILGFIFAFLEDDPEERTTAFIEPWVIIIILALNAVISVVQEINAQSSVDSLKSFQPNIAHAIRDGEIVEIAAEDLVCGDIIEVGEGQQVPADCRIIKIKSTMLKADEAALTGEPPVDKEESVLTFDEGYHVVNQDKHNCCFGGTPITRGRFQGIVFAVGVQSEIGKIKKSVDDAEDMETPLQVKLDKFGDVIAKAILVICIITWFANISKFKEAGHGSWIKGALSFFKIAISLAVAAIPEGLPAVVTTTLSLGVNRMAKEKAIVTKLPAVETLGCTSVICSDKTGTLTTNMMTVKKFSTIKDGEVTIFDVEGNNYSPEGSLQAGGIKVTNLPEHKAAQQSALIATTCNDATIILDEGKYKRNGEPTEAAFKVLAEKIGLPTKEENDELLKKKPEERFTAVSDYYLSKYPKIRTHEFTRDRKSMSVVINPHTLVVKGAYEVVLSHCDRYMEDMTGEIKEITPEIRERIDSVRHEWAGGKNCFRCLGLAYKDAPDYESWDPDTSKVAVHETGLIWCGAVGIIDPHRDTVPPAIKECHSAGIRVIMCTGDNIDTATAIARNIGMLKDDADVKKCTYTGAQWSTMSQEEREEAAKYAVVMARVEPQHKQDLVTILQNQGHVVAMTGDGVNDAPALKKADIGIAMGTGTKVAQDAAKMILSDDSFATIVKAVSEGRAIYNNTTAFIRYLITCNIGEVVSCFVSSIIGGPNLLRSTQLLFVNLVTDGLPAMALGVNPAEPGVMDLPPRSKNEEIVTPFTLLRYLVGGAYLGFATIAVAYYWYMFDSEGPRISFKTVTSWMTAPKELHHIFEDDTPSTLAMSILVVVEMFSAFTAISERQSIFKFPPWKNLYLVAAVIGSFAIHILTLEIPFMQRIFSVVHLDLHHWLVIFVLALPTILIEEIFKFILRLRK